MNWYKQAISEQDFYKLYALEGLSDEDYKQNPVFLYELIEHLNYIREYYLNYLYLQIAKELEHSYKDSEDALNYYKAGELIIEVDHFYGDEDDEFYGYGDYTLKDDIRYKIESVVWELRDKKTFKTDKLLNDAIYWFKEIPWSEVYGGESWALIAEWTKRLSKIGRIQQQEFNLSVIKKIRELIFILDTIHSIAHNTNIVLINLPEGEGKWLPLALEVVKNAQSYLSLAQLTDDRKIREYYRREKMPLKQERMEENIIVNTYKNGLRGMIERYQKLIDNGNTDEANNLIWFIQSMFSSTKDVNIINSFFDLIKEEINTESYFEIQYYAKIWQQIFNYFFNNDLIYSNKNMLDDVLYILEKFYSEGYEEVVETCVRRMAYKIKSSTKSIPEQVENKIKDFVVNLNNPRILAVYKKYL